MLAIALLAVSFLFGLLWLGRVGGSRRKLFVRHAGALALGVLALAVLSRGQYALAAMLVAGAALAWFWQEARARPEPAAARPAGMTDAEARAILGVGPAASREEIQAAYRERIRRAHPDQGGSTQATMRLNAARDHLLRR
jgi:hypothetical protein